jgi:hypothetical protein
MPEADSREKIDYALTADGYRLPVIDITNPRFRIPDDPEFVDTLRGAHLELERRQSRLPKFLRDMLLHFMAGRSLLMRGLIQPDAAFLPALTTYAMKLGPDNLAPPFDSAMDRQAAAWPLVTSVRIRLQQTATLLADGIRKDLAEHSGAPLHLINIGGGTAIDSINALVLLNASHPELLARSVTIHVLDIDARVSVFGANALAALRAAGRPLCGVNAGLMHSSYDWNNPEPLRQLVRSLASQDSIVTASSEGALFEYADDSAVRANLDAVRLGGGNVRLVAGSVTRADPITRRIVSNSRVKLVPRGIDAFASLARDAGFQVDCVASAVMSDQVLLRPC